jgi:hypothetical protein
MMQKSAAAGCLPTDERWKKMLARFTAIDAELQELYWEVVSLMDKQVAPCGEVRPLGGLDGQRQKP